MRKRSLLAIAAGILMSGIIYAAITVERFNGTSDHIGLWNGPAALTARTLNTPKGEITGLWHYHPGFVYNVETRHDNCRRRVRRRPVVWCRAGV